MIGEGANRHGNNILITHDCSIQIQDWGNCRRQQHAPSWAKHYATLSSSICMVDGYNDSLCQHTGCQPYSKQPLHSTLQQTAPASPPHPGPPRTCSSNCSQLGGISCSPLLP